MAQHMELLLLEWEALPILVRRASSHHSVIAARSQASMYIYSISTHLPLMDFTHDRVLVGVLRAGCCGSQAEHDRQQPIISPSHRVCVLCCV